MTFCSITGGVNPKETTEQHNDKYQKTFKI